MKKFWITFSGEAEITVNDDRVILRITENRDDEDRPEGSPGWDEERSYRKVFYSLETEEDVLDMLLYAAVRNAVQLNRLGGWGDLEDDAADVRIGSINTNAYTVEESDES